MGADKPNPEIRVLVTGASGYIGIHCVQQLLIEGYQVRGTVRSTKNAAKIQPLKDLHHTERLELVEADLNKKDGWPKAVEGCTYILHVASPFPIVADETVIQTAVDGTMNVLRAAAAEPSVKKVVVTSSCAAINEGHKDMKRVFSEKDWSDVNSKTLPNYSKSKTLAEKAAWDYVKNNPEVKFKLTTINPSLVVGPLLHNDQGASVSVVKRFLNHEMPALPGISMGLVDVRDVTQAHIRAMREPKSDGERILMTSVPSFWFRDIADVLHKEFSSQGYCIPRMQAPYAILWIYSFFDAEAREVLCRVGNQLQFDTTKAQQLLGIKFTDPAESLVAMAYDMIERGIVPKKSGYKGPPSKETPTNGL